MEEEKNPTDYGITPLTFKEWRSPRFGHSNPHKIESPVWEWLVHSKLSGYSSTEKMNGPSPFDEGPTWSFDRLGKTKTKLPDGRTIYISGEHEDHYDPDFYIYNDVIVEFPNGKIDFYCYPKSEFLPTDFHTATLVEQKIIIIGNLGYPEDRKKEVTQVYLLDLNNFQITKVSCTGDSPGWIHSHKVELSDNKKHIFLKEGLVDLGKEHSLRENIDDWQLDIESWRWERLTEKKWPRWELCRVDKAHNHIYDIRQALWNFEVNWKENLEKQMERLEKSMGFRVDFQLINTLYDFDFEHEEIVEDEEEYNLYWIYVNGVRVRFVEERRCLKVTIEGSINDQLLISMKDQLISKLSELERTKWILKEY